ncbi:MAG: hypothetical protein ABMA15_23870, partial [Vicinamibacterales bacterium]
MPPAFYAPVAILSVFLFGVPIAACIAATGERRVVILCFHSFVAGILGLALAFQACWTAGFGVHRAAPWVVAAVVLANIAVAPIWLRLKSRGFTWSQTQGLAAFVFVALMTNAVYAVNSGEPYYGRAWGDQLNYSLLAHYLRVGPPPDDALSTRPAMAVVAQRKLLSDRIGQSFVHAWVAELTHGPELETFHATGALAILATTAVAFLVGLAIGAPATAAAVFAVAVAMAPPTQSIVLESFLSQALGTPFVVYAVVVASLLLSTGSVVWLALLSAATAWVCIAYFEFLPVLIGAVLTLLVASRIIDRRRQPPYLVLCAALAGGVVTGLLFNSRVVTLIARISGLAGFEKFFPFAYSAEGITRLVAGDAAVQLVGPAWKVAAVASVTALTATAMAGFVSAALRRHAAAVPVLALTLVPWAIRLLPGEHSYQFYKLLQSFWPYTWLGLGALTAETSRGWLYLTTMKGTRTTAFGVAFAAVMATAAASLHMVAVEARGESPRSGINGYLRTYGTRQMRTLFNNRRESNLVVSLPDRRVYQDGLFNGVAALQLDSTFVRMQSMWLATNDDQEYRQSTTTAIPGDQSTPNVRSLDPTFAGNLSDLLVLQIGSSYLRPDPSLFEEVASYRRMHVFHPVGSAWLLARTILPQPVEQIVGRDEQITAGNHPPQYVRLDIESGDERQAGIGITVRYHRPAGSRLQFWHVYSNGPYGTVVHAPGGANGEDTVVIPSGPLRRGVTQIYFGPRSDANPSSVELTTETATITDIVYGGP